MQKVQTSFETTECDTFALNSLLIWSIKLFYICRLVFMSIVAVVACLLVIAVHCIDYQDLAEIEV